MYIISNKFAKYNDVSYTKRLVHSPSGIIVKIYPNTSCFFIPSTQSPRLGSVQTNISCEKKARKPGGWSIYD